MYGEDVEYRPETPPAPRTAKGAAAAPTLILPRSTNAASVSNFGGHCGSHRPQHGREHVMGSGPYTVVAHPSCSSTATPLSPPPPYVDVKVEDEDVVLEEEMAEPPVVDHNAVHTQSTQSTQVSSVSSSPSKRIKISNITLANIHFQISYEPSWVIL
eukprot:EG_transcript_40528